jgi:hypothetical protein
MLPNRRPDWQGIWGRLRKLGIEFPEDCRNGIAERFETLDDSTPIGWRSFLERYIEREAGLHVHIINRREVGTDVYPSDKWCATLEWPASMSLEDSEVSYWLGTFGVVESEQGTGEVKVAVLVDVPEFIENRKRLFGRILPVVKRLQPLDVCAQTWPDSPETPKVFGRVPRDEVPEVVRRAGREKDGEPDISPFAARSVPQTRDYSGRSVPVGEGELPNKMVKRRAEVVDNVSNDGAPLLRGRFPERVSVDDFLASVRTRLGFDFVRVAIDEPLDSLIQEAQVHIRPIDLDPTSVQRVAHD